MDYIKALEEALGIEATKNMLPLQLETCWKPARILKRCTT